MRQQRLCSPGGRKVLLELNHPYVHLDSSLNPSFHGGWRTPSAHILMLGVTIWNLDSLYLKILEWEFLMARLAKKALLVVGGIEFSAQRKLLRGNAMN